MKQKDFAIIAAVVIFSGIVSVEASKYIFAKPANRQQQVVTVGAITTKFTQPSAIYFNNGSIDPAKTILVNLNANTTPFGTSSN